MRGEDHPADPEPLRDRRLGAGPCDPLSPRLKLSGKPFSHAFPKAQSEVWATVTDTASCLGKLRSGEPVCSMMWLWQSRPPPCSLAAPGSLKCLLTSDTSFTPAPADNLWSDDFGGSVCVSLMAWMPKYCLLLEKIVLKMFSRQLQTAVVAGAGEHPHDCSWANRATWGAPRLWGISQVAWEKWVGIRLGLKRTLSSHSIVTFDLKGLVPGNCACLRWSKFKLVTFYQIGKEVVNSKKKSWENFLLLLPYSCRFIF